MNTNHKKLFLFFYYNLQINHLRSRLCKTRGCLGTWGERILGGSDGVDFTLVRIPNPLATCYLSWQLGIRRSWFRTCWKTGGLHSQSCPSQWCSTKCAQSCRPWKYFSSQLILFFEQTSTVSCSIECALSCLSLNHLISWISAFGCLYMGLCWLDLYNLKRTTLAMFSGDFVPISLLDLFVWPSTCSMGVAVLVVEGLAVVALAASRGTLQPINSS